MMATLKELTKEETRYIISKLEMLIDAIRSDEDWDGDDDTAIEIDGYKICITYISNDITNFDFSLGNTYDSKFLHACNKAYKQLKNKKK